MKSRTFEVGDKVTLREEAKAAFEPNVIAFGQVYRVEQLLEKYEDRYFTLTGVRYSINGGKPGLLWTMTIHFRLVNRVSAAANETSEKKEGS